MLSNDAERILALLRRQLAMEGPDLEAATGLGEKAIKAAAIELRNRGLITTSGAPDHNEESGMAIDRLVISASGKGQRLRTP